LAARAFSAATEAGAHKYIQKPCTLDALREKLRLLGFLKT
jgi:DNA-binding response OmpR family regulator